MHGLLKWLFFALLVRPVVLLVLGLNVRNRERLPVAGPAIIAANHNSHLDTLVLMSLLPRAAADYFLSSWWLAAFAVHVLGIVPVVRAGATAIDRDGEGDVPGDVLAACEAALRRAEILIVFPEGTRGEPEAAKPLKSGVARLLARVPETVLVPVVMHGLGKTLPKGAWLPVPFTCDVLVGTEITWSGDRLRFMEQLRGAFAELRAEGRFPAWD